MSVNYVTHSVPLTQPCTLWRGKFQADGCPDSPDHYTGTTLGEVCVGSGHDSVVAPVFTDSHLHISRPMGNEDMFFCFLFFLFWGLNTHMQLPAVAVSHLSYHG